MGMLHKKEKWMVIAGILITMFMVGCQQKDVKETSGQNVEYELCQTGHMPKELEIMIEEKKKEGCAFSYKNSMYTYMVVCYGLRESSGYSIRVEECSRANGILFLRTQLIGPEEGELAAKKNTWPYIVVRCRRTEDICMIET